MTKNIKILFFGTDNFSKITLEKMKKNGFLPSFIVTAEDKPVGRKLVLTPPPVKKWAEENNIEYIQPKTLKDENVFENIKLKNKEDFTISVVSSYGKIIPKKILDLPEKGNLNVHPSLLPKLRGPSPIETSILTENETGVTIILLDEEMDHGDILSQEKIFIENWPPYKEDLEKILAEKGGEMLCQTISKWLDGKIKPIRQDHNKATFCKKIKKEDALIDLNDEPKINLRKIKAFSGWPNAFFFFKYQDKNIRIIVKKAHIENDILILDKIIPEGKKEMSFEDFKRGLK